MRDVRAGKRKHLLFPAAQRPGDLLSALSEHRKGAHCLFEGLGPLPLRREQHQVLADRERRKDATTFWEMTDPASHALLRPGTGDVDVVQFDRATSRPEEPGRHSE